MKSLLPLAAVFMCMTLACAAAPDQNTIAADLQSRYSWIPQNEVPEVKARENTYYKFGVAYPKSDIYLQIDDNGNLVSAFWNSGTPENKTDYSSLVNEDFIWNLRPDLPRDKMVQISDGRYYYKRPDGVIDPRVTMAMNRNNGVLTGFVALNKPNNSPSPRINISEAEARNISKTIAANSIYDNGKGEAVSWPYYYETHPEWARPTLCTDDTNSSFIAYDFSYEPSDEPNTVINNANKGMTHGLCTICIRINATTGDAVSVIQDFYAASHASMGVKTNKPISRCPAIQVSLNAKEAKLGFPLVAVKNTTYIAMPTLQSLAKGHTVAAKAGAKAFSLNGKQFALDTKVLDREGVLYLPWQSLNNLPGVNAQFDAKQPKLSITAAVQNTAAK